MHDSSVFRFVLICLTCSALSRGALTADDNNPPTPASDQPELHKIKSIRDITYYEGEGFDKVKHKLDLYVPADVKNFPVLFFVHGGGWRSGDKDYYGVYSGIGRFYAKRGIGSVVTNYRLSPKVKHPGHIQDVARAFAWTHKNIAKYGGRPDMIFPCGHSAGGHLVALLATDLSYLKAEGVKPDCICGVIPISGLFQIPPFLSRVFGDRDQQKNASPLSHAKKGLPPFLILYADKDLPYCGKDTAEEFKKALMKKDVPVESQEIVKSNHFKIILNVSASDKLVSNAILSFIMAKMKK